MLRRKELLLILFIVSSLLAVAQTRTISGYITDRDSGEPLIGAAVYDGMSKRGTVTNAYGFYTLTLPIDSVSIEYSYVGYTPLYSQFVLRTDTTLAVALDGNNVLQEVTITAAQKQFGAEASQMSAISVPIAQIKSMPAFLGETDVIKSLQLLPGVQGGIEGSAGMYVRGGGPDENLLLLDGVPVYNVNHMFGFFSVFDADAIKSVTLYKGSFPAHFGGRLSSVVDIRMNDGNMYDFHGNFSLGLVSSKFHLEGPLWKGHTSFSISARRTYYDVLMQPILAIVANANEMERISAGYYFWDLNAKVTHTFSDRDKLFASFYMGDDVVYANVKMADLSYDGSKYEQKLKTRWKWGNIVAALRWNHIITSQLFLNTSVNYTQYRYRLAVGMDEMDVINKQKDEYKLEVGYNSGINDITGKVELDYTPTPNHNLRFGANYTFHTYRPGVNTLYNKYSSQSYDGEDYDMLVDTTYGDVPIFAHEMALYAEDDMTFGKYFKANIGLHYSSMSVDGKYYQSLQPRVSMRALLYKDLSLKIGYAYMTQYVHLLSNNNVSLPSDLWVPITADIKPMNVHQWSAGMFYDLHDWVSFSVEGYYKRMDNLLEYKDGASFLGSTTAWDQKVCQGRGWSYGVEFLVQRSVGNTTGWIGYTWSRAMRLFDREGQELNQGKPFPAKYDRIHDFSLTLAHKFSDKFDISGSWVFSTGNCATLALQNYKQANIKDTNYDKTLGYIEHRNNYRYENYHRLDLGANFHYFGKRVKRINHTWSISVYNVYNHKNPFFMYMSTNWMTGQVSMKKLSIFPIIPTVTYSLKF